MERILTVTVAPAEAGQRLDKFLAGKLPELSRARLQALLGAGDVVRDGAQITDPSRRVKPGQGFTVRLPPAVAAAPAPQPMPLDVLYEDADLLVLDKPAGLVVHPAPGHAAGTLVNGLLAHCAGSLSGIGGVLRPGIVHRIDKDVSGLLVIAKHDRAHVRLSAQFSVHRVERAYDAVVWGRPAQARGSIEAPIGRDPRHRKRMAVVAQGKRALTHYEVLRSAGTLASWMRMTLATGRTHQIRVHLASIGLGIVGDPLYRPRRRPILNDGGRRLVEQLGRLGLHACLLGFEHPSTGEHMRFERAAPAALQELFAQLSSERPPFISG